MGARNWSEQCIILRKSFMQRGPLCVGLDYSLSKGLVFLWNTEDGSEEGVNTHNLDSTKHLAGCSTLDCKTGWSWSADKRIIECFLLFYYCLLHIGTHKYTQEWNAHRHSGEKKGKHKRLPHAEIHISCFHPNILHTQHARQAMCKE